MRLVLWDVDGTLVHTAGHGRDAFGEAFRSVFGRDADLEAIRMGGRTDHWIAMAVLRNNGVADGAPHLEQMFGELERALQGRRELIAAEGQALPGAHAVLRAIAREPDTTQSLLTGNIEPNAAIKLSAFGLERFVDLEIGGYGSDHGVRSELVRVVHEKAAVRRGLFLTARDTVVIGDTPHDVDAAKTAGAKAVGVATGEYGVDALRSSGADVVLEDLADLDSVLAVALEGSASDGQDGAAELGKPGVVD